MTTVLAFGAFDGLHEGHAHFLGEAAALGDRLVVALATDEAIRTLKQHEPRHTFDERREALRLMPPVEDIVASDASGKFSVIDDVRPDMIAIGYDQDELDTALRIWMANERHVPVTRITSHEPERYKSSLL